MKKTVCTPCRKCVNKSFAATSLNDEELLKLESGSNQTSFSAEELVFKQGSDTKHIIYIQSGLVKVYRKEENGHTTILNIINSGNYINLISTMGKDSHFTSAECIKPTKICLIEKEVMFDLFKTNTVFANRIIETSAQYEINSLERMVGILNKNAPGKVASTILYLSELETKEHLSFNFTHSDFASLIASSTKSVARTLKSFMDDSIISMKGRKIIITNRKALEQISRLG